MARKILVFTPYFLPGFKGGGPIKSIKNMVDNLEDEFEFWIVTSDRDFGDEEPYLNVEVNKWNIIGKSKVFYAEPAQLSMFKLTKLLKNTPYDVLYLNSFFNIDFSIKVLIAAHFASLRNIRAIILAPRGEFSSGALQIKAIKKYLFISMAKFFCFHRNVFWQATSALEKEDIIHNIGVRESLICEAKNLPSIGNINTKFSNTSMFCNEKIKVIFLSRISPKKNLDYALRILKKVNIPVYFDIYGPKEDIGYWSKCQNLIDMLPNNIKVDYLGLVEPEQVSGVFTEYDLFFFPTHGENYGHVIAESLLVGTPVLISDQTPWRNLSERELGWDIPLIDEVLFVQTIEKLYDLPVCDRIQAKENRMEHAYKLILKEEDVLATRKMFLTLINSNNNK